MISLAVIVAASCMFGMAQGAEYGENDYTGMVSVPQAEAPETEVFGESDEDGVKCFLRYRWYRCYWYRPVVYYYRPVYYYRTYTVTRYYTYRYRYISFYKSFDTKSATNDTGVLMTETPAAPTPLAAHGIQKGDVITHIDGKAITNPEQLDKITATSQLVVLKVNGGKNPEGMAAPRVPSVSYEYGAFEY